MGAFSSRKSGDRGQGPERQRGGTASRYPEGAPGEQLRTSWVYVHERVGSHLLRNSASPLISTEIEPDLSMFGIGTQPLTMRRIYGTAGVCVPERYTHTAD